MSQVRLHALLYACRRIWDAGPDFSELQGGERSGSWYVSLGSEGHLLACWDPSAAVMLCYSSIADCDGQGVLDEDARSPEAYLRFPEQTLAGGTAIPKGLAELAMAAEAYPTLARLASSGYWASEHEEGGTWGVEVMPIASTFFLDPEDAVFSNDSHLRGWASEAGVSKEVAQLAIALTAYPWSAPHRLSSEEKLILLNGQRAPLPADAEAAIARLQQLGVLWGS